MSLMFAQVASVGVGGLTLGGGKDQNVPTIAVSMR